MAKQNFSQKLLSRLERIDKKSMEGVVAGLLRESERHTRVLDSLEDGLLLTDAAARVTSANQPFLRMFQIAAGAIEGRPLADFLGELGIDAADLLKNLLEDRQTFSNDLFLEKPSPFWARFHAVPLADPQATLEGICLTVKDITYLKQQEQKRQHAERLGTLIPLSAGLAHEIGNPLGSLDIQLQLAERELRDLPDAKKGKLAKHLQTAKEEIKRLDRIVSQFLGAIRPYKPNFKMKRVDDILDSLLDFMAPQISAAGITVERRFQTNLPATLLDEDQIKQAFTNLILNAVQAMPKGGRLKVQTEAKNQQLRVVFSDTGVGIPAERLGKIFEPYYSTKEKGSGLGLVIVTRILSEHGGSIHVKSAVGKGSQFTVLLPMVSSAKPLLPQWKPQAKPRRGKRGTA